MPSAPRSASTRSLRHSTVDHAAGRRARCAAMRSRVPRRPRMPVTTTVTGPPRLAAIVSAELRLPRTGAARRAGRSCGVPRPGTRRRRRRMAACTARPTRRRPGTGDRRRTRLHRIDRRQHADRVGGRACAGDAGLAECLGLGLGRGHHRVDQRRVAQAARARATTRLIVPGGRPVMAVPSVGGPRRLGDARRSPRPRRRRPPPRARSTSRRGEQADTRRRRTEAAAATRRAWRVEVGRGRSRRRTSAFSTQRARRRSPPPRTAVERAAHGAGATPHQHRRSVTARCRRLGVGALNSRCPSWPRCRARRRA